MEIVDARGQVCPRPIIMTKNVFDELEEGTVKTQVDDMYYRKRKGSTKEGWRN